MNKKFLILLIVVLIMSLSCDEGNDATTDSSFVVNIISPSNGDSIDSYPMLISLSVINPQNISYINVNLNGSIINQLYQFSNTENIAYTPSPNAEFDNIILSAYAYSNHDDSFISDSVNISISTINQTLINSSIALLPANDFLFTKHLISNQLYSDFLNEINNLETIISSLDSMTWYDNYGNTLIDIQKTHLNYNSDLNLFTPQNEYGLHPISGISWYGANMFATYMGWELPSVEQWQYIARGDSINWVYPYGDGYSINENQANYGNNPGTFGTTEIGSFPEYSMMGAKDIVGNVWQFTKTLHPSINNYILVGGSYQSPIDNICLNDTCFTAISSSIISSTFGFRCITEAIYNAPELDCNNDVSTALIDDCGDCTGGLTGIEVNAAMDYCGICDGDGSICPDCNGDLGGSSITDDCGECTDGNTGLEFNYLMDCNNVCNGNAILDKCGNCDADTTNDCTEDCAGIWGGDAYRNLCDDCICQTNTSGDCDEVDLCGCFDIEADNFGCHLDPQSCYENSTSCCGMGFLINCNELCILELGLLEFFSNPLLDDDVCNDSQLGCTDYENPYHEIVEHTSSLCEYWGCTDNDASNFNSNATNCLDGTLGMNSSCCEYNTISVEKNSNSELNITMQNSDVVSGFQINIPGVYINGSSGGSAEDAGFMVSASETLVLGFSLSGNAIPSNNTPNTLTLLSIDETTSEICIDELIVSGVGGIELNFKNGSPCQ